MHQPNVICVGGVVKHMEMNINLIVLMQVTHKDPRCMYGKLPHINAGCRSSLPLDSKCQLKKFKYVCCSWKGT